MLKIKNCVIVLNIIKLFGYAWTVDLRSGIKMFFSIYFLELIYACLTVWPAWLLSGYLKIKAQLDVYDFQTNLNPFKFN